MKTNPSSNPSQRPGVDSDQSPEVQDKGKIAGIAQNIKFRTKRALEKTTSVMAPGVAPVKKVMEAPGVRNRIEGAKGLIGAASVSMLKPIAAAKESKEALKQIVDGKERVVKPPKAILMSTPTGLLKTAKGAAKMVRKETREEGAAEAASGVREVIFGDDDGSQMAA